MSVADNRSERTLRRELQKAYPDFSFHLEESGYIEGTRPMTFVWTLWMEHELPPWPASLRHHHWPIIRGQARQRHHFDPIRDELFGPLRTGGFFGQRRLRPGQNTALLYLVGTNHVTLTPGCAQGFRNRQFTHLRLSSPDLAYVAPVALMVLSAITCPSGSDGWNIDGEEAHGTVKTSQDYGHPTQQPAPWLSTKP